MAPRPPRRGHHDVRVLGPWVKGVDGGAEEKRQDEIGGGEAWSIEREDGSGATSQEDTTTSLSLAFFLSWVYARISHTQNCLSIPLLYLYNPSISPWCVGGWVPCKKQPSWRALEFYYYARSGNAPKQLLK